MWIDPKDYSIDRAEFHMEHTGPDGKPTYVSLTMNLHTVMLKEIKPGGGALHQVKGGHFEDELFNLQLPPGAEDRTQSVAQALQKMLQPNR
jgi:hypothetical protein